jgi:hypothetical protein
MSAKIHLCESPAAETSKDRPKKYPRLDGICEGAGWKKEITVDSCVALLALLHPALQFFEAIQQLPLYLPVNMQRNKEYEVIQVQGACVSARAHTNTQRCVCSCVCVCVCLRICVFKHHSLIDQKQYEKT